MLDIVWWARNLSDVRSGRGDGTSLAWLLVIIDIALCLIAAGTVGVAIYVAPKLRNRDVGNVGDPRQLLEFPRGMLTDLPAPNPPAVGILSLALALHVRFGSPPQDCPFRLGPGRTLGAEVRLSRPGLLGLGHRPGPDHLHPAESSVV